jgi:hypothetical protein
MAEGGFLPALRFFLLLPNALTFLTYRSAAEYKNLNLKLESR